MHILSMSHIYKRSQSERNWPCIQLAFFFYLFLSEIFKETTLNEHGECFIFIVQKSILMTCFPKIMNILFPDMLILLSNL